MFLAIRRQAVSSNSWRSGALGDLGAHVIDLARYLVVIDSVSASTRTFQPGREVDDAFEAVADFENGAIGRLRRTLRARSQERRPAGEINGSRGRSRVTLSA